MNYSFLEPLSDFALSSISAPHVSPIPAELSKDWKDFERELGVYKTHYARARADATMCQSRLASKSTDVKLLEIVKKVIKSADLKSNVAQLIENFEQLEGVEDLKKEYGEALGRVEAMKQVLCDTNAERYARFTCFICMESRVDCLLIPCNHAICERCWLRTRSTNCPGCRQDVVDVRKIFTLS